MKGIKYIIRYKSRKFYSAFNKFEENFGFSVCIQVSFTLFLLENVRVRRELYELLSTKFCLFEL